MKKKRRPPKKRRKGKSRRGSSPSMLDPRAMEKTMADIGRLLESQEFESIEEANAFLNQIMASGEPLPAPADETPLQKAQTVMYDAWAAKGRKRIKLAKKALKISEDCADAYVLLAEEAARSVIKARDYYEQGVRAGERAFGPELFAEYEGHFWGITETRPYMRARAGLATTLWLTGKRSEAIEHLQEMLRLNPGDNQGNRYILANWLLEEERHQELEELLAEYEDDASASWAYNRALLAFRQEGLTARATEFLRQAIIENPFVPRYLLGKKRLPRKMPDYVGLGDENEAVDYVAAAVIFWADTDGALNWLETVSKQGTAEMTLSEIGDKTEFAVGDSVVVRAGIRLEEADVDLSGWQGRVISDEEVGVIGVLWDSQTLRDMPESFIEKSIAAEVDWMTIMVDPEMLAPAQPRDEESDWIPVATDRYSAYGLDLKDVLSLDEDDWEEDDWEEDELEPFPPFDLAEFISEWEIPQKEAASFRRCLSVGLGKYFNDLYGDNRHGKRPTALVEEYMGQPYIFGYAALEIINHKRISRESKLKVCGYTLGTMALSREHGLPYGMVTLLGFLAREKILSVSTMQLSAIAMGFSVDSFLAPFVWMRGATSEALITLADWLVEQEEMSPEEKLWWAWQLSVRCSALTQAGKAFARYWLAKEEVAAESKLALCRAWLSDGGQPGTPPLFWRLSLAQLNGDQDQLMQLLREVNIDPEEFPLIGLEDMPPSSYEDEDDSFIDFLRNPSQFLLVPAFLKRLALPALVRFGEDVHDIIDKFWDVESRYYRESLNQGVADVIAEFHERLSPDELRRSIERGIAAGEATTRKTFYALASRLFGDEYLEQALADKAKIVRRWAAKEANRQAGRSSRI